MAPRLTRSASNFGRVAQSPSLEHLKTVTSFRFWKINHESYRPVQVNLLKQYFLGNDYTKFKLRLSTSGNDGL
jgi:hypothetical protein